MDLIRAVVLVTDVQLLKFSGDVVGCSNVGVPGRIYRCTISNNNKSFVGDEVFLEAMPTFSSGVIWLEAHLAERLVVGGVVEVALIIVAAVAATVVATMAPTIAGGGTPAPILGTRRMRVESIDSWKSPNCSIQIGVHRSQSVTQGAIFGSL